MQAQIKEEPNQEVDPIGREHDFQLVDNHLTPEDFVHLKIATGFIDRPLAQVCKALANDLFDVSIHYEGTVVGIPDSRKRDDEFSSHLNFIDKTTILHLINSSSCFMMEV